MVNFKRETVMALDSAKDEEPWDGYYLARRSEVENLVRSLKLNDLGNVLELGCGNGFVSCLLSAISKKVTATDLFSRDSKTHTLGIENAKRLISKLGKRGISLLACSIEHVPFKDDTFDTVFSSYTLHYLKDRRRAICELKRVVKKDGLIILMVPGFMERIWAFFQFYLYLGIKFLKTLKENMSKGTIPSSGSSESAIFDLTRVKERYSYFPFPGPHGAYRNSAIEMIRHMPVNWNREFSESGLKVESSFTTTFIPYHLLLTISLKLTSIISSIFAPFTRACGDKPLIKYLGCNYCVALKK